jgi:hypothetical protein
MPLRKLRGKKSQAFVELLNREVKEEAVDVPGYSPDVEYRSEGFYGALRYDSD